MAYRMETGIRAEAQGYLLPIKPVAAAGRDACALAAGIAVLGHYKIGGVTQSKLAELCGVAWPPVGGMRLDRLADGFGQLGLRCKVGAWRFETIMSSIRDGHPVVASQIVDARRKLGHAVVITGYFSGEASAAQVVVSDNNIAAPLLIDLDVLRASSNRALYCLGRVR